MKKAGILTIVIVVLAVAGILAYQYQKTDSQVPGQKEQGTLVKEKADGRYIVCEN